MGLNKLSCLNWKHSVFPITHPTDEKSFGTAFLCHQNGDTSYFLTCSHVIKTVTKGTTLLPLIAGARAVEIVDEADDIEDVALVKVRDFARLNERNITTPKPLALLAKKEIEDIRARTYGSSNDIVLKNARVLAELELEIDREQSISSTTGDGPKDIIFHPFTLLKKGKKEKVVAGNSGSPVVDTESNKVIGIIAHNYGADEGRLLKINNLLNIPSINRHINIEQENHSAVTKNKPSEHEEAQYQNSSPWFYHTIDHDYLTENPPGQDKLFFGVFTAQSEDSPNSFAKHYYSLMQYCSMDEDVEKNVLYINLDSFDKQSFRKSLLKWLAESEFNATNEPDPEIQITDFLSNRNALVLHCAIKTAKQQKNIASIIQGAIDYIEELNAVGTRIAVLFSCKKLPKRLWGSTIQLPEKCQPMGSLRKIQEDDIDGWLEQAISTRKINGRQRHLLNIQVGALFKTQKQHPYKAVIECLESYHFNTV